MTFNWCHGPECHTKHTVDRVRGVKGSKVLRTRKVRVYSNNNGWYSYFCSQRCYDDFTIGVLIATTFTIKWFLLDRIADHERL